MPTVQDIVRTVGAAAPWRQAAEWDTVGLQVGDADADVTGILVALDATPQAVDEAVARGANVLLTHHPSLFKTPRTIVASDPVGGLVLKLAQAGVAHIAAHTNLDASATGVSVALARQLGLDDVQVLAPLDDAMHLVVTYAPEDGAPAIREALAEAGAGQIGAYAACSFSSGGTGRFTPGDDASPAVGQRGVAEAVPEVRVEAVVPTWHLANAITGVRNAHSYEDPVVLSAPVTGISPHEGFGAIGTLPDAEALDAFLMRVSESLGTPALRHVGDSDRPIQRVAVCGGSGLSFLPHALRAGADAFVTADITYHRWFEALSPDGLPRLALIDAGHYETERIAEALLVDIVSDSFADLPVSRTDWRTDPSRFFTAPGD